MSFRYFDGYEQVTPTDILREEAEPAVLAHLERSVEIAKILAVCADASRHDRQIHAASAEILREIIEQRKKIAEEGAHFVWIRVREHSDGPALFPCCAGGSHVVFIEAFLEDPGLYSNEHGQPAQSVVKVKVTR